MGGPIPHFCFPYRCPFTALSSRAHEHSTNLLQAKLAVTRTGIVCILLTQNYCSARSSPRRQRSSALQLSFDSRTGQKKTPPKWVVLSHISVFHIDVRSRLFRAAPGHLWNLPRAKNCSLALNFYTSVRTGAALSIPVGHQKKTPPKWVVSFFGDPYGNRTHVTAVKGPCLNRLTNGP